MILRETEMDGGGAKVPSLVISAALIVFLLGGCGPEPPAPSPTLNPHAHKMATILITVSDARVDNVKVASTWQLGNVKCAPIIMPEGYLKDPHVSVDEVIKRFGNSYRASILLDRFKHDKCNWFLAVSGIDFMSNGKVYVMYGFDPDRFEAHQSDQIVCMPSPIGGGVCVRRPLNQAEEHIEHKFKATVEYVP